MTNKNLSRQAIASLAISLAIFASINREESNAQTTSTFNSNAATATAGATNNWNQAGNWSAGIPTSTIAAIVPQNAAATPIPFTLRLQATSQSVNSLEFQNIGSSALGITLNSNTGVSLTFGGANPTLTNTLGSTTQIGDNTISAPITLASNLTVAQNHTASVLAITGLVSGSGGITKTGAGILQLGNTTVINTYAGATSVNAGVLRINSPTSLPGGIVAGASTGTNLVINGGVLGLSAQTSSFTRDLGAGPGQVQFTGSGGFAGFGVGRTVNFGGSGATLVWNSTPGFLSAGQTLILGSTLANNNLDFQNAIDFNGAVRTIQAASGSGAIDGQLSGVLRNGGLSKIGNGTLRLSGTSANTFTGLTTVTAGNLQLGKSAGVTAIAGDILIGNNAGGNDIVALQASDQIADTAKVTLVGTGTTSGIFRLNGFNETIGGVVSSGSDGIVENNNATLASTLNIQTNGSSSFGGVIRDGQSSTLSISLGGTGTQILSGTNTYTGSTTVTSGTLEVGSTGSLASSSYVVNSGGSLVNNGTLGGSGLVTVNAGGSFVNNGTLGGTNALTVSAGSTLSGSGTIASAATVFGTLSPGNSPGILTFGSGLTQGAGSALTWELITNSESGRGTNFDGINVTGGDLTINGLTSNLVFNGTGSAVKFNDDFWRANHSWTVFSNSSGTTTGFANLGGITTTVDSEGFLVQDFGSFGWSQSGQDLLLQFTATAVPEPSAIALISLVTGSGLIVKRRRDRKAFES